MRVITLGMGVMGIKWCFGGQTEQVEWKGTLHLGR